MGELKTNMLITKPLKKMTLYTRAMLKHSKASERMFVCLPFSWYLATMYHRAKGGGTLVLAS